MASEYGFSVHCDGDLNHKYMVYGAFGVVSGVFGPFSSRALLIPVAIFSGRAIRCRFGGGRADLSRCIRGRDHALAIP